MIKKLAKEIFNKNTSIDQKIIISLIEDYIKQNNVIDLYQFYDNLKKELMRIKRTSVYLNSDQNIREIFPKISGVLKFVNHYPNYNDVLYIIGNQKTETKKIISEVNKMIDEADSEEELLLRLQDLKKELDNRGEEIAFMLDEDNFYNISRLKIEAKQGENVESGKRIGYFEDFKFNEIAQQYIIKFNIVDQYCERMIAEGERIKNQRKEHESAVIKRKTLNKVWKGSEQQYNQLIHLLATEDLLKDRDKFLIKGNDDKYKWNLKYHAWQRYMAGLMKVLSTNSYLEPLNAVQCMNIFKNTFLDDSTKINKDAFEDAMGTNYDKKYTEPFNSIVKGLKKI